ncbi:MAG: hypothetical protein ACI4SK_04040 [Christensenellales bacterium]
MKKIIGAIALSVLLCAVLIGCTSGNTVSPAWADEETLVYSVVDTLTKEAVGEMTVKNVRRPDDKTLGGASYDADGRTEIVAEIRGKRTEVVFLTKQYHVLAEEKTYTDETGEHRLNSRHSGKYAYYSVDGGAENKINVGSSGYTESEYLYNYIRCYALTTPPTSVKIADYATGTAKTVTASAYGNTELPLPHPDGTKNASCVAIEISLSDTPSGKPIYVWFASDATENNVYGVSISPSKKFPVKIIENDLTYTLKSISVK